MSCDFIGPLSYETSSVGSPEMPRSKQEAAEGMSGRQERPLASTSDRGWASIAVFASCVIFATRVRKRWLSTLTGSGTSSSYRVRSMNKPSLVDLAAFVERRRASAIALSFPV